MTAFGRKLRSLRNRLNARARGIQGAIPPGSTVAGGRALQIGAGFFASGPVWLEAVTSYAGERFNPQIVIGRRVCTSPRLHVSAVSRITIGDDVLFGENVFVTDHQHGSTSGDNQTDPSVAPAIRPLRGIRPVSIGARCHLGNNVVVLPGTILGDECIVGANAVVSGEFPSRSMLAGAPARIVKTWSAQAGAWVRSDQ